MQFDLPLDELRKYKPERKEPPDFDAFWQSTLDESRRFPLGACFDQFDSGLKTIETYDVTFNGFAGQPIKGWLLLPAQRQGLLPCVVEFIGYGGGRGHPLDWLDWSAAGYAHLVMDTRGQGSAWLSGDTPDHELVPSNPQFPGFMTRGILDPSTYYFRRLITDAVRAVETACSHPEVNTERIAVTGTSQGGGLSLAVAALAPMVAAVMPDVPFLCHFRRATEITDSDPYHEIALFCKIRRNDIERVFNTLDYFDGLHFAARAHAPALFSTGLMDDVSPPSTVFAAYNWYAGEKQIRVWPYNRHEGGETYQMVEKIRFLSWTVE